MKEHEKNDYCSAQEAAKILKIYPAKLSLWRKIDRNRYQQDRIPYIRRGYWIFYRRKDVYAYKEKMDKEKNGNARI